MTTVLTKSGEDTKELAAAVASIAHPGDVILLAGDLGAGKTTFTQGFGRALGVEGPVTSPTVTLLNHYHARDVTLLHADVYRLDRLQEIVDLGLTELIDDTYAIAIVEWGDVAEAVLPKDFLEIRISYPSDDADDDRRVFAFRAVGRSWTARLEALAPLLDRWAAA